MTLNVFFKKNIRCFLLTVNFSARDKKNSSTAYIPSLFLSAEIYIWMSKSETLIDTSIHRLIYLSDRIFNFYALRGYVFYSGRTIYRLSRRRRARVHAKKEREIVLELEKQNAKFHARVSIFNIKNNIEETNGNSKQT